MRLLIISLVILLAVFLRFWHIRDYVVFLGDEGRDMIIMRDMFVNMRLTFLGPTASVGGFYLGPIYYWMAAPFLLLFNYDPAGPAYFVGLMGVATVLLLFKFLKESVGFWPAIVASILYATAPLIVRYSRSSWNPNPLPFFALLIMYCLYQAIEKRKNLYFLVAGASFGIAIQLHYLASILVPIVALIILINVNYRYWLKTFLLFLVGFIFTFSPFLIFEIKHNFPNFRTILEFVTRGSTAGFKSLNIIGLTSDMGRIFLGEISTLKKVLITTLFFWFLAISSITGLVLNRSDKKKRLIYIIATSWFLVGLAGLRFYSGQIYDYYFGFMFPAPFLLLGLLFSQTERIRYLKPAGIVIAYLLTFLFLSNSFYKTPSNKLIGQTTHIADFVIEKSDNKPFNFALITDGNSDDAYRYFLEIKGKKPVNLGTLVTDQLIVVCESKKCEPLGNPTWEIAGFGRAEIDGEWNLDKYGFKIFRLTHWPGEPSPAGKPAVKGK